MRKLLCTICMLMLISNVAFAENGTLWVAIGGSAPANIRSSPSSEEDNVIGEVERGDKFEDLEWEFEKDRFGFKWIKIPYGRNYGWVRWSFFSIEEPSNLDAVIESNGRVRLREEPDTNSKRVKWIESGTKVKALAKLTEEEIVWYKIRVNDKVTGWIMSEFIEVFEN